MKQAQHLSPSQPGPSHSDRVVAISGAGRGIGHAVARAFQAKGYRLSLGARSEQARQSLAADFPEETCLIHAYDADDDATAEAWITATEARFGRLDVLVNNAGISDSVGLLEGDLDALDTLYRINVRAPFLLTRLAFPLLAASGRGRVIVLASLSGKRLKNRRLGYAMSKSAAVMLAHGIRREGWEAGIRACAVCPGFVETDMARALNTTLPDEIIAPDELANMIVHTTEQSNTASVAELLINARFEDAL